MTPQTTSSLFVPQGKRATLPVRRLAVPPSAAIPRHIALASSPSARGASAGVDALNDCISASLSAGVSYFSLLLADEKELARHPAHAQILLQETLDFLRAAAGDFAARGIAVRIIGARPGAHGRLFDSLCAAAEFPVHDPLLHVSIALNYDGRADLLRAVKRLAQQARAGAHAGALDAGALAQKLSSGGLPPVDLLIRAAGRTGLSHFLLWNAAYAELLFVNVAWSEFRARQMRLALDDYARRRRTFGALPPAPAPRR